MLRPLASTPSILSNEFNYSDPVRAGDPVTDRIMDLSVDASKLELIRLVPVQSPPAGHPADSVDGKPLLARLQLTSLKNAVRTEGSVRLLTDEWTARGWTLLDDIVRPYDGTLLAEDKVGELTRAFVVKDVAEAFHQIGEIALAKLEPPRTYLDLRVAAALEPDDPKSQWLVELAYSMLANLPAGQAPPPSTPGMHALHLSPSITSHSSLRSFHSSSTPPSVLIGLER